MEILSLSEFGRIVAKVMEELPEPFLQHLDNLVVEVRKKPTIRQLKRAGFTSKEIEDGETLLGFFEPMDIGSPWIADAIHTNNMEHRITIFKEPLEEAFPTREQLLVEIRKTVVHELAHHFGWSEEDLEKFDNNPNPFVRRNSLPPESGDHREG